MYGVLEWVLSVWCVGVGVECIYSVLEGVKCMVCAVLGRST